MRVASGQSAKFGIGNKQWQQFEAHRRPGDDIRLSIETRCRERPEGISVEFQGERLDLTVTEIPTMWLSRLLFGRKWRMEAPVGNIIDRMSP